MSQPSKPRAGGNEWCGFWVSGLDVTAEEAAILACGEVNGVDVDLVWTPQPSKP